MLTGKDQYVNIHAHRLAVDSDEWVLTNLRAANDINTEIGTSAYYSIGIHPWDIINTDTDSLLEEINSLAKNERIIAIGETGIDKAIDTPVNVQSNIFERHIEIAEHYHLPVIIHAVKSNQELIYISKTRKPKVPLIIHGFNGGVQLADDLLNAGFYLSIGNFVRKSAKLAEAVKTIPLDSLFLETDDSGVSIHTIYQVICDIKGLSVSDLKRHMLRKVNALFKRSNNGV